MTGFLKALVILPVAIVVVLFSVANRGAVTLSFDPFARGVPDLSATLPLYAVLFATLALGVLIGGTASWLAGARERRHGRRSRREVARLKVEAERLRAAADRFASGPERSLSGGRRGGPAPSGLSLPAPSASR